MSNVIPFSDYAPKPSHITLGRPTATVLILPIVRIEQPPADTQPSRKRDGDETK